MPHLLLAIDETPATRHMVDYVSELAPQLNDCSVWLVAVIPNLPSDSRQLDALIGRCSEPQLHGDEDQSQQLVTALTLINEFTCQLVAAGLSEESVCNKILPERLGIAQDICEEAQAQGCDTIVVGRRHATLQHLLFGSVSSKLVEKAHSLNIWVIA